MHTPAIITNNLSRFRGKRRSAVARLRRLAALACNRLPAESLNLLTCYTAMLLDLAGEKLELQSDMFRELKREQAGPTRACLELSTTDREFLRRIGIRPSKV